MNKFLGTGAAVLLSLATLSVSLPATAQGVKQVVAAVDVVAVGTGYRSSKIVGSAIVNGSGDSIGKLDDLIISKDQRALYAVLSVGGYLGMGNKLVVVRYEDMRATPDDKGFVLAGATKESLKALPEFAYAH